MTYEAYPDTLSRHTRVHQVHAHAIIEKARKLPHAIFTFWESMEMDIMMHSLVPVNPELGCVIATRIAGSESVKMRTLVITRVGDIITTMWESSDPNPNSISHELFLILIDCYYSGFQLKSIEMGDHVPESMVHIWLSDYKNPRTILREAIVQIQRNSHTILAQHSQWNI